MFSEEMCWTAEVTYNVNDMHEIKKYTASDVRKNG